jgi:hypothetical protein
MLKSFETLKNKLLIMLLIIFSFYLENMTLLSKSSKGSSSPPTYSKINSNLIFDINLKGSKNSQYSSNFNFSKLNPSLNASHKNSSTFQVYSNTNSQNTNSCIISNEKKYHLIKVNEQHSSTTPDLNEEKCKQLNSKLVSEVYLTRLLATKVLLYL